VKVSTVVSSDIRGTLRFDSKFHFSRRNPLIGQIRSGRWPLKTIGETFGQENIWTGNIFARVYASSEQHGKPLLVPYDLFRYMPWSDKILSRSQVGQFERLEIKRGWLFLVCSGRNLGPVTIADAFCERFTMSHDMVRIAVEPSEDLFYLAAFLSTRHGQAAVRTDMNGSVIDHTDERQVACIQYPTVPEALRKWCAGNFERAFEKREQARLLLERTIADFERHFGLDHAQERFGAEELKRRFAVPRSAIVDRLDAEPHAPTYRAWRNRVEAGGHRRLDEIADVYKPFGRYKTNYVEDERFGIPMMNGRQIAQYKPIALRLMNLDGFRSADSFVLRPGMTVLTADGRAEENLADCALITDDRLGWAASGHVYRIRPRTSIHSGRVYLACACEPTQARLKALATGSVVDALNQDDVATMSVPYDESPETFVLAEDAQKAWNLFSAATEHEREAISALEAEFEQAALAAG
jgi:hypothetical protein